MSRDFAFPEDGWLDLCDVLSPVLAPKARGLVAERSGPPWEELRVAVGQARVGLGHVHHDRSGTPIVISIVLVAATGRVEAVGHDR